MAEVGDKKKKKHDPCRQSDPWTGLTHIFILNQVHQTKCRTDGFYRQVHNHHHGSMAREQPAHGYLNVPKDATVSYRASSVLTYLV